ncbi:MAG: ATP-binding protein [Defluviitaleaceae bacterium]|nr:ATP-binding protein [Defluviitaleaceae bacterium]
MAKTGETIKLSFPVNPAYVSSARLTASSIANRMGFDIDEIEDIKTAVSEACTYIIRTMITDEKSNFEINFILLEGVMEIHMVTSGMPVPTPPDEMSLMMIKALVDDFKLSGGPEKNIEIFMIKKHISSFFE